MNKILEAVIMSLFILNIFSTCIFFHAVRAQEEFTPEALLAEIDMENKNILVFQNLIKISAPTTFIIHIIPALPEKEKEEEASPSSWLSKMCCFCCLSLPNLLPVQPKIKTVRWDYMISIFGYEDNTNNETELSVFDYNYRKVGDDILLDISVSGDYRIDIELIQICDDKEILGEYEYVIISYPQPANYLVASLLFMAVLFFAFIFFRQRRRGRGKPKVDIT